MADITITIQTGQTSVVRTIPDAKVAEYKSGKHWLARDAENIVVENILV